MDAAWVPETGAINCTFSPDGTTLDTDQYYRVFSKGFAAAALLALKTSDAEYWHWFDCIWAYANRHFVDHRYGGWYRILDWLENKYRNEKNSADKTDYHPLATCFEVLEAQRRAESTPR